ncbi:MAG: hypothetical protein K5656_08085 [Lachnospiraceae bacterium]|nr:hypothetical protein [Lachnospiraceae bacterium]
MQIIEIIKKSYKAFMALEETSPRLFWIVVLVNLAIIVFLAFANVIAGIRGTVNTSFIRVARDEYWYTKTFLGKILHELNMISQFMLLPVITVSMLTIGKLVTNKPKLFNDDFYIELIAITLVAAVIKCILIKSREKYADHFNMETGDSLAVRLANVIILSIIYGFIAFIAIFTSFEKVLPGMGVEIFGQTLGATGYACYVTVLAYIIVRAVGNLLSLLSMLVTIATKK